MEFSKHCQQQIKERNLDPNDILAVLRDPLEVILLPDYAIYQGIIIENEIKFLLRIFVNLNSQPEKIITVYKTSKLTKYLNR